MAVMQSGADRALQPDSLFHNQSRLGSLCLDRPGISQGLDHCSNFSFSVNAESSKSVQDPIPKIFLLQQRLTGEVNWIQNSKYFRWYLSDGRLSSQSVLVPQASPVQAAARNDTEQLPPLQRSYRPPAALIRLATSSCPLRMAWVSGETPSRSAIFGLAPAARTSFVTSR
jgi:hypothetical protein